MTKDYKQLAQGWIDERNDLRVTDVDVSTLVDLLRQVADEARGVGGIDWSADYLEEVRAEQISKSAEIANGISQYPDSRESVEYKNGYYAAGRSIVKAIESQITKEPPKRP